MSTPPRTMMSRAGTPAGRSADALEPADALPRPRGRARIEERITAGQPADALESGEPSAAALAEALLMTMQSLKSTGRACVEEGDPALRAISLPRGRLLMAMDNARDGRLRMGDLSAALGVTPRNITTIVDGLEREGLIARKPDHKDRRAILLELTRKGREHIAGIHALHRAMAERFFAPLDGAERCEFMRLLGKIRGAYDAHYVPCPTSE